MNIYRVYYNFFERRPYTCPNAKIGDLIDPPKPTLRESRIPGTDGFVDLPPRTRRSRARMMRAARHGMGAFTKRKDGSQDPTDIYRILCGPWFYMGAKLAGAVRAVERK